MKAATLAISAAMLMMGSMAFASSTMYGVDEDHDGRADRMLILEQSDSLA